MRIALIKFFGSILRFYDFKGFWRICHLIGFGSMRNEILKVGNFALEIPIGDAYWNRLLSRNYKYEPEITFWLKSNVDESFGFLDCGANIGYWTVFARKELGIESCLAVEPNPFLTSLITRNLVLNQIHDALLIGAVTGKSTQVTLFYGNLGGSHAGSSTVRSWSNGKNQALVVGFPINDLIKRMLNLSNKLLVKLDVEGMETECLSSIEYHLWSHIVVIYEDHGKDLECSPTAWLLDNVDVTIYLLQDSSHIEIQTVSQLRSFKVNRGKGYNLVAVRNRL
jgi:FkbM family methyltransferase